VGYRVTDALRTIKVLPGDLVLDVEMVTIQTTPTGITATWGVPIDSYLGGAGAVLLGEIADGLEELVSNRHAIAGVATQRLDDAGFIADTVDMTIAYVVPNGGPTLTGIATVSVDYFTSDFGSFQNYIPADQLPQSPADACDAEYNRLKALAGG
jgi:hypothetical protein